MKGKIGTVFASCTMLIGATTVADFPARADDVGTVVYNGISRLRETCGAINDDPHLTAAAQQHANDMLQNSLDGHTGSDGSSPGARIAEAGYASGYTGEIVYWGTGSNANPAVALDLWMESPPHRAIIMNCSYTAGGFAAASDGNKMTVVGDFAGP